MNIILIAGIVACLFPIVLLCVIKALYAGSLRQRQKQVSDIILDHNKRKFGKFGIYWNVGKHGAWISAKINQNPLTDHGSDGDSVMGGPIEGKERFGTKQLDKTQSVIGDPSYTGNEELPVRQVRRSSIYQ